MFKIHTVEELAEDAFVKAERVKMLGMMNSPTDYEERKKAFVDLAKARDEANKAEALLLAVINQPAATAQHSTQHTPRTLFPLQCFPW